MFSHYEFESMRLSYLPPPTIFPNYRGWLPSGPLAYGSNSAMSLSNNSSKTEPTTRSTFHSLIRSFKYYTSSKNLHMSTLLVSPSTMDINMSFCPFCNCSSYRTSFKACSHDANCALTSANCCVNAAHFFCSSLCINLDLYFTAFEHLFLHADFFPEPIRLIFVPISDNPPLNDMHHAIEAHTLK